MRFLKELKIGSTVATLAVVIFSLAMVGVVVYFIAANFNLRQTVDVRLGAGAFKVWIAQDPKSREQGLSGVDSLRADGGLLMEFPSDDTWSIWMKDMKIPIDIIWLDSSKKVVYIVHDASPDLSTNHIMKPKTAARYVLELPAGSVSNIGASVGQVAEFDLTGTGKVK